MKQLLSVIALLTSQGLWAGTESHGGGGWDCGPTEPIELVDFYEASYPGEVTPPGLTIVRTNEPVQNQIQMALQRLNQPGLETFAPKVAEAYQAALRDRASAQPGSVAPPMDLSNDIRKPGCELVGLAKYNDRRNRLLVDDSLLARMTPTDQAALWLHESIYKVLREGFSSLSNSKRVRKMVGYLFSDVHPQGYPPTLFHNLKVLGGELIWDKTLSATVFLRVMPESSNCPLEHFDYMAYRFNQGYKSFPLNTLNEINLLREASFLDEDGGTMEFRLFAECNYRVEILDASKTVVHSERIEGDGGANPYYNHLTVPFLFERYLDF